jgi:hypothetical protein
LECGGAATALNLVIEANTANQQETSADAISGDPCEPASKAVAGATAVQSASRENNPYFS